MINWDFSLFGDFPITITDSDHPSSNITLAIIHYFMKVSLTAASISNVVYVNLACVSWCFPHPNKNKIGKPAQIWCHNLLECDGVHSFIPISLIRVSILLIINKFLLLFLYANNPLCHSTVVFLHLLNFN